MTIKVLNGVVEVCNYDIIYQRDTEAFMAIKPYIYNPVGYNRL